MASAPAMRHARWAHHPPAHARNAGLKETCRWRRPRPETARAPAHPSRRHTLPHCSRVPKSSPTLRAPVSTATTTVLFTQDGRMIDASADSRIKDVMIDRRHHPSGIRPVRVHARCVVVKGFWDERHAVSHRTPPWPLSWPAPRKVPTVRVGPASRSRRSGPRNVGAQGPTACRRRPRRLYRRRAAI